MQTIEICESKNFAKTKRFPKPFYPVFLWSPDKNLLSKKEEVENLVTLSLSVKKIRYKFEAQKQNYFCMFNTKTNSPPIVGNG